MIEGDLNLRIELQLDGNDLLRLSPQAAAQKWAEEVTARERCPEHGRATVITSSVDTESIAHFHIEGCCQVFDDFIRDFLLEAASRT